MVSDNNTNTDVNGNLQPNTDHNGNEAPQNGANGVSEAEAGGATETNGAAETNGATETNGASKTDSVAEEEVKTYTNLSVCFLCAEPAQIVCEKCGLIAACSEKHMKLHR